MRQMSVLARIVAVAALSALLAGCNLRPLYAGGTSGVVASELGHVEIEPIAGKAGWLVRNALKDQLEAFEGQQAKYRLTVALEDKIAGFGVRSDDRITRERRTLRARYQLVRLSDSVVVLEAIADGPGRLNDEANSASLFGDKRYIVLRLNSGEAVRATAAIETLLASETGGDPVFVIAPGMGDKTALAKSSGAATDALIATC